MKDWKLALIIFGGVIMIATIGCLIENEINKPPFPRADYYFDTDTGKRMWYLRECDKRLQEQPK
jgi:hypothetical protein